jgi:Zn-finger in Ran binding protein and others
VAVYEGRWDCDHCGHVGNRGPALRCSACDAERPADVRFYLPGDALVVTDAARLKEAAAGADWVCGHCDGANKAGAQRCVHCAHPRQLDDPQDGDHAIAEEVYEEGQVPHAADQARASADAATGSTYTPAAPPMQRRSRAPRVLLVLGVITTLLVGSCSVGLYYYRPHTGRADAAELRRHRDARAKFKRSHNCHVDVREIPVLVTAMPWSRVLRVEAVKPTRSSGRSLPAGAQLISTRQIVVGHKRVQVGSRAVTSSKRVRSGTRREKCGKVSTGNGYFRDRYCTRTVYTNRTVTRYEPRYEQRPIHATEYSYWIDTWTFVRDVAARGTTTPARWPKAPRLGPRQRIVRLESYAIRFARKDKVALKGERRTLPHARWQQVTIGQEIPFGVDPCGGEHGLRGAFHDEL